MSKPRSTPVKTRAGSTSSQSTENISIDSKQEKKVDMKTDLKEIKEAIREMSAAIAQTTTSMKILTNTVSTDKTELLTAIQNLTEQVKEKDQRIAYLEDKVNDLEQYQKKNNIIISGPANLPSYSHVASNENDSQIQQLGGTIPIQEQNLPEKEEAIRRQNFIKFAETKLQIHIKEEEILAIHDLHKRRDGTVPIIVKFMRSSTKQSIMINRKKLKKSDIFINEHLTQRNMEIEKKARRMKKDGVIHSVWTWNGKVYIKETESSPKKEIKNISILH